MLYNGHFRPDGSGPATISGLAWIGSACNGGLRTSVNLEFGQYGTVATAAHELGHKYAISVDILELSSKVVPYHLVGAYQANLYPRQLYSHHQLVAYRPNPNPKTNIKFNSDRVLGCLQVSLTIGLGAI